VNHLQVELGLAVISVALAFVTSAWVNAVSRLTIARARRLEEEQPKRGALLVKIAEDPRPYLTAALLVMLLWRVLAIVLFTAVLMRAGSPAPEVVAAVVSIFVMFQLAEIAPRTWVLERPDQVMLFAARPVWALGVALRPVAAALVALNRIFLLILPGRGLPRGPLTSEEEIKSILGVAESEEVIETEEREMIHSIFDFGDTVAREVMVPRPDMVCVEADTPLDDVLAFALKKGFSRIPVTRRNIDNIVGIIYTKDVVRRLHNGSKRVRKAAEIARDAAFVPESKKVAELLREMQRTKTHMVIVVDEYGGTAGLVTMEDLLEEIVGEISDEYDRDEPNIVELDAATLRVNGRLPIDELSEVLNVELPHAEWDSVGGLVGGMLGRVASEGDVVKLGGVEFQVEKTKGRRIDKVLVHRGPS
jgi:magnesium and cobalt exporter, CNNM family